MKVKYVGPLEAVQVVEARATLRRGDELDVPAELGERLLEQAGFEKAGSARKAAAVEDVEGG